MARIGRQTFALGAAGAAADRALAELARADAGRRLWQRDASLWTASGEERWLGWLALAEDSPATRATVAACERVASRARELGLAHTLIMGMGGSSLCPDVLARSFPAAAGHPSTLVLDSTVPAAVEAAAARIDPARTAFVVASKSGGTIEPNAFCAFFWERAVRALGERAAGERFVAITDPGSSLERLARERGFGAVVAGLPDVGGRFSALSAFGLVPAALQGLDVADWLARARAMARACGPDVAADANPGLRLGAAIGALAAAGRDKLTLAISPAIASFGGWLEQLVAESTGKRGRGVVPIDGEPLPAPDRAGDDRLFVALRLASAPDAAQDAALDALEAAGQPVVRIELDDARDLAGEIFRFEVATAIAGAVLGVDPFDQPDVESAKVEARALMAAYERDGALPSPAPLVRDGELAAFADPALGEVRTLDDALARHLARAARGDYVAINAWVAMDAAHGAALARLRDAVARATRVPTTLGYGPRFLHSTGQLHKGGPDRAVVLQVGAACARDLAVPGAAYSFGVLARAQAQGDFAVLVERGRRALRVELPGRESPSGDIDDLALRIARIAART